MAIDAITGRVFAPVFKDQKTAEEVSPDHPLYDRSEAGLMAWRSSDPNAPEGGMPPLHPEYLASHGGSSPEGVPGRSDPRTGEWMEDWSMTTSFWSVDEDLMARAAAQGIPGTAPTSDGPASSADPTDSDEFRTLKGVFLSELALMGLDNATIEDLWDWVERRFVADPSFTAGQAAVEMKDQQAFIDRFPGIASMRAELDDEGRPAARRDIPTAAQYLARERLWATYLGKYGMTALGADLDTMVAQSYMRSIGEGEFVDRLKAASEMIYEAPEAVKNTFGDWFGNHADAALMAVFLDPSNEVFNDDWVGLKGDVAAAEVGGWSKMHLGLDAPVTQERSRAIAGLGWRDIDIWEGLDALKAKEDLFIERIGEVDYQMEVEGVAAEFGIDTETLSGVELNELIDRRASRRSADFSGGGGAMLTGTTTGFGAANA
jgi:hypothetical protein